MGALEVCMYVPTRYLGRYASRVISDGLGLGGLA